MFPEKVEQNHELLYKLSPPDNYRRGVTGISYKAILMPFVFIISCFTVLVGLWQLMRRDVYVTHAVIQTDRLVHKTDQNFLSVALDTSRIQDGWVHKNIKSEVLLKMTVALAPAYLRVGGTMADRLIFQPECSYSPVKDKSNLVNTSYFNMTACDWIELNRFAHAAGLQLLFDLNVLLRNGTEWDSSNARLLLDFSDKLNFDISWQLGNEPNSFNHVFGTPLSGHQLGQDFVELRRLLNSYPRYNTSLLVGPDVTRPLIHQIGEQPIPYLKSFLARATGAISAITWHQYYLNGRKAKLKDFVSPDVLNILACQISALCSATTGVHLPLWLSETGSAYGGGAPGLSDRFVAGFLWLDKLGMAAHLGVDVVVRQSLCGGNYGLLGPEMEPLPDWWVSVLYKKLVGLGVLNVVRDDIIEVSCLGEQGHVRLYCHCANQRGAVTLFGVNVMNRESHVMVMGLPPSDSVLAYVLTADAILSSRYILLNGRKLSLKPDGSLPPFKPKFLNISKPLVMPAFSMVFWVIEDVHVPVCEDT